MCPWVTTSMKSSLSLKLDEAFFGTLRLPRAVFRVARLPRFLTNIGSPKILKMACVRNKSGKRWCGFGNRRELFRVFVFESIRTSARAMRA